MREKKRVDDDWKRRAAEEKERLSSQVGDRAGAAAPTGVPAGAGAAGAESPFGEPPVGDAPGDPSGDAPGDSSGATTDPNFIQLVSTLGGQAMMALGLAEDPHTGQRFLDLDLARQSIDLLGGLEVKTRGNLSGEESHLLGEVLHQLRISYSQRIQQAQQAAQQPPPGAGPDGGA